MSVVRWLAAVFAALWMMAPPKVMADPAIEVWMPDGQLISNPVRIYITHQITSDMKPTLRLLGSHALTAQQKNEGQSLSPLFVARDQSWEQIAPGDNRVQKSGSLLLFDVSSFPMPRFKAMMRLTPLVEWTEGGAQQTAIAARAANLGNPVTAWTASAILVVLIVGLLVLMLGRGIGRLIVDEDGTLSLSRLQIALWTLAVSVIVFGHGLIQLDVPAIPESIVALLGLALLTGGLSYLTKPAEPLPQAGIPPVARKAWSLADLVSENGMPSIARAQMLVWTILMIVLFLVKSILNGLVWEVPWTMVALMGVSQGSYLAPKFVPPKTS